MGTSVGFNIIGLIFSFFSSALCPLEFLRYLSPFLSLSNLPLLPVSSSSLLSSPLLWDWRSVRSCLSCLSCLSLSRGCSFVRTFSRSLPSLLSESDHRLSQRLGPPFALLKEKLSCLVSVRSCLESSIGNRYNGWQL